MQDSAQPIMPRHVEGFLAEAPRSFQVRVVETALVEREHGRFVARVGFGQVEGVVLFRRDFPVIECPRVGQRWTVTLQPEREVARG